MKQLTTPDLERLFARVATGAYSCLEYQGISVGFHSDEAPLVDWVHEFFGGYFVPTAGTRADSVIYSSQDADIFRQLKELAITRGEQRSEGEVECAVDRRTAVIYKREVDVAKGTVDENCFVLSDAGRRVLVAAPGTLKDRWKTIKRSMRGMTKLLLLERGWLAVHSAACGWNGTGICILGGKYAGKTSTLVNLLMQPGATLVTNDTLLLRDGGSRLDACGFPNKAGLRVGALAAHTRALQWIERTRNSFYPQIDAETFRDLVANTPNARLRDRDEKIVLLATELAELFGSPIQQATPIQLVLVVRFDPSLERSRLVPVTDPSRIKEHLAANLRTLAKEKHGFLQRFFPLDDRALHAGLDALVEKFGRAVTARELHQSGHTNEHSAALVGELTQQLRRTA